MAVKPVDDILDFHRGERCATRQVWKMGYDVAEKIKPHAQDLFDRLNDGDKFETVVADIADLADVTPGQVILFVDAIVESQPKE